MIKALFSCFFVLFLSTGAIAFAPIAANEILRSPKYNSVSLSPSGKLVSATYYDQEIERLVLIETDSSDRKFYSVLRLEDGLTFRSYRWLTDNLIYVNYGYRGNKYTGFHSFLSLERSGKKIKSKIEEREVVGRLLNSYDPVSERFFFLKDGEDGKEDILYHLSVSEFIGGEFSRKTKFQRPLRGALAYFAHGNESLFGLTLKGENIEVWNLKEPKDKWYKLIDIPAGDFEWEPIGFLKDGSLAVLTNKESDRIGLYSYDIRAKKILNKIYEHQKYDLINAAYNFESKTISNVSYSNHGKLSYSYLNSSEIAKSSILEKQFKGMQFYTVAQSKKGDVGVVGVFDSAHPAQFYLYKSKTGSFEKLFSLWSEIEGESLSKTIPIKLTAQDGSEIEAFLNLPPLGVENNKTLLVNPHGGPIGVKDTDYFDPQIQFFALRGYSTLRVNFRGSAGYGKEFQKSGVGQFGKKIEKDISRAVEHVFTSYDFKHMCSMGASYGGYSAIMLAINNPGKYDCVIAMYGVYDLPLLFSESSSKLDERYQSAVERTVGPNNEKLYDFSPVYSAEKLNSPLLLVASVKDEIAIFEHTKRMQYVLDHYGKEYELIKYKGINHGHSTWFGERHESVYVDHFIRNQLGIDFPSGEQFNKVLANDFEILADGYLNKSMLDQNGWRAFRYYSKAAEYGSSRSMFNIGSYYHEGKEVDGDLKEAVRWYERASKEGFAQASWRLANLKKNKNDGHEYVASTPLELYKLAFEQGFGFKAQLNYALEYCKGEYAIRDLSKCFSIAKDAIKNKNSRTTKGNAEFWEMLDKEFSLILFEKDISDSERLKTFEFLTANANFTDKVYGIEPIYIGSYSGVSEKLVKEWKKGTVVPAAIWTLHGAEFELSFESELENDVDIGVIVEWSKKESGQDSFSEKEIYIKRLRKVKKFKILRLVEAAKDLNTIWDLKVYDLSGRLMFSESYTFKGHSGRSLK